MQRIAHRSLLGGIPVGSAEDREITEDRETTEDMEDTEKEAIEKRAD